MSCTPGCLTPGCPKDHGKVCEQGSMCDKRSTCQLYHPPRNRQNRLNSSAPSFVPQVPQTTTATIQKQQNTSTPQQNQQQQQQQQQNGANLSPDASKLSLNVSAKPFSPTPPVGVPTTSNNQNPSQPAFYPPNQYYNQPYDQDEYFDEDDEYFDEDEEDFYDSEDEAQAEFSHYVDMIRQDPKYQSSTDQEIEALANELYYSSRFSTGEKTEKNEESNVKKTSTTTTTTTSTTPNTTSTTPPAQKSNCNCCDGNPALCEGSTVCISRGICICVDDEVDHAKLATWVVSSRLCKCCEGFVYRCKKQQPGCSKGECDCNAVKAA